MIIKSLKDSAAFTGGDGSVLKELLHPAKEPLDFGFSLARAEVGPGGRTLPHRLKSAEVYFILEGKGRMHIGDEQAEVVAEEAVYIPPGQVQFIENPGPGRLTFLCIVDPAWTAADEEVLP
jgi:mannose-6-phosphate isomerase-like protein (cupin superfamily)